MKLISAQKMDAMWQAKSEVMEPLEMVIMHEKVWHPHTWWYDGSWTLYDHGRA